MCRFGVSVRFPGCLNVSVSNDGSKSSPQSEVQSDTYSFILITSQMILSCSRQVQYSLHQQSLFAVSFVMIFVKICLENIMFAFEMALLN